MGTKRSHDAFAADNGATAKLNSKHPRTTAQAPIGAYSATTPLAALTPDGASSLPALPPLPAGPLRDAPFTHPSCEASLDANYERLEFLGDAYIEVAASRLIFARFPRLNPARQTSLRETLVRNSTLARFAAGYGFAARLRRTKTQPVTEKVLGDMLEAYVAAVVLADPAGGFAAAEAWLEALWAPMLLDENTFKRPSERDGLDVKAKERLNALLWAKPVHITYEEEQPHAGDGDGWEQMKKRQMKKIGVHVQWFDEKPTKIGVALGVGKKEASQLAAADALENIANGGSAKQFVDRKAVHDEKRKRAA